MAMKDGQKSGGNHTMDSARDKELAARIPVSP